MWRRRTEETPKGSEAEDEGKYYIYYLNLGYVWRSVWASIESESRDLQLN